MKVLVTGSNGQLGHDVVIELLSNNIKVEAPSHLQMDITNSNAVIDYFQENKPDAVIHCAAYTAVDKAEEESDLCMKVNVEGTKNIVDNCIKYDIPLMYISTDYVFDGSGKEPKETDEPTCPINTYGLSKRNGEIEVLRLKKHFILRISWVFGFNGNNFIKTMLRLSKDRDTINVVDDQFGSPTYTKDLAILIVKMIATDKYGIYHAHNNGVCSWADLAEETFRLSEKDTKVNRIQSDQYPMKAKRPYNSRLSTKKLLENGFSLLPDWKDALNRYIQELKDGDTTKRLTN